MGSVTRPSPDLFAVSMASRSIELTREIEMVMQIYLGPSFPGMQREVPGWLQDDMSENEVDALCIDSRTSFVLSRVVFSSSGNICFLGGFCEIHQLMRTTNRNRTTLAVSATLYGLNSGKGSS